MQDGLGFLVNLSVSLVLALLLGLLAQRLRLSPIIGYLLAGFALGPRTPGFVADPKMAHDFAEVGADGDRIQKEIQKIRAELGMRRRNGQITLP